MKNIIIIGYAFGYPSPNIIVIDNLLETLHHLAIILQHFDGQQEYPPNTVSSILHLDAIELRDEQQQAEQDDKLDSDL